MEARSRPAVRWRGTCTLAGSVKEEDLMRKMLLVSAIIAATFAVCTPVGADETNKLTTFTFSKAVQLPGLTLQPGQYRFELADPKDTRRVIKVSNEDGTKQLGMLLTIPSDTLPEPAKDGIVLFGEAPASEPDAIKAWIYVGERTGYEFVYPNDEAIKLAKRYHTSVLSKSGDKVERVDEAGTSSPSNSR
jgi:hypothetical protein